MTAVTPRGGTRPRLAVGREPLTRATRPRSRRLILRAVIRRAFPFGVTPAVRRAVDVTVHAGAGALERLPGLDPGYHGLELERDLPYRPTDRRAHLLDVVRPAGGEKLPLLLYVHGGAFSMLSKDTHLWMAMTYAKAGYVVFNINYRLGPRHRYPAQIEDASAALGWALDEAHGFGADPRRVVLAGESAGANLVTTLAYLATHRRPEPFAQALYARRIHLEAVLGMYGIYDLHRVDRFWTTEGLSLSHWVRRELAWAARSYVGESPESAPLASPLRLLAAPPGEGARPLPPFFLTVGTRDPLLGDSRRLHATLDARGVQSELQIVPGEIHGFNAMPWRPAALAKWRAVFGFLERARVATGG